jgi:hypothetical protein
MTHYPDIPLAQLIALDTDVRPQTFTFTGPVCTIGRRVNQDIQIEKESISRQHAEIRLEGGQFFIVDLNSRNGTFVNGTPITPRVDHVLRNYDTLGLGSQAGILRFINNDASTIDSPGQPDIITFNQRDLEFSVNSKPLRLGGGIKFKLFRHLYEHRGMVCSLESCVKAFRGDQYRYDPKIDDQALYVHIAQIRTLLEDLAPDVELIKTLPMQGYKLF